MFALLDKIEPLAVHRVQANFTVQQEKRGRSLFHIDYKGEPFKFTSMITSILDNSISIAEFEMENYFGLMIPKTLKKVEENILNPINSWVDKEAYDKEAKSLANKFKENFNLYGNKVNYLINSGPII